MIISRYIIVAVLAIFCVQAVANNCDKSQQLSENLSYMADAETIRNLYGSTVHGFNVDGSVYSDIVAKYLDVEERHGDAIKAKMALMLEAEFDCTEIDEINKFASGHYGKIFFEKYFSLIEKISNYYAELAKKDVEMIRQEAENRNILIMDYLRQIKELDTDSLIPVVVANNPILAGDEITTENASIRQFPPSFFTDYYVMPKDFETKLQGKIAIRNISSGAPIIVELVK